MLIRRRPLLLYLLPTLSPPSCLRPSSIPRSHCLFCRVHSTFHCCATLHPICHSSCRQRSSVQRSTSSLSGLLDGLPPPDLKLPASPLTSVKRCSAAKSRPSCTSMPNLRPHHLPKTRASEHTPFTTPLEATGMTFAMLSSRHPRWTIALCGHTPRHAQQVRRGLQGPRPSLHLPVLLPLEFPFRLVA